MSILAFVDSSGGLVPCRVVSIHCDTRGSSVGLAIHCKITASRAGYDRGDFVTFSARTVVPRYAVYRSRQACGQTRIKAYDWRALFTLAAFCQAD